MSDFNPELYLDFTKKQNKRTVYRKQYKCSECKFAEEQPGLPENYIHCTKYPNMISDKNKSCKASEKK